MRSNEQMDRQRQIPQDFMTQSSTLAAFALDGTVRALRVQEVDVEVRTPSRVEGRFRTDTIKQKQLGEVAVYQSYPDLLNGERETRLGQPASGWTIDDIPADVRSECDAWAQAREAAIVPGLQAAAREMLQTPVDRMTATEPCPHCRHGEPRYACRSSGWSREVYSYPLMRLRDDATNEVFEVPFDAALYIDEHTPAQAVTAVQTVDANGRLSAALELGLMSSGVSAAYVARATNGRMQPQSSILSVTLDGQYMRNMRRALDRWQEPSAQQSPGMPAFTKLLKGSPSGREMIEELQAAAVRAYTERFTDIDYNQLFHSVRQKLGAKGLLLAFNWHYQGMGENEASYQILTPQYRCVDSRSGMDPFEALTKLSEKIDTMKEATPRRSSDE